MLNITPEAAGQLQSMLSENEASALKFDAEVGEDGGFDCSVSLTRELSADALVHEVDGIKLAFSALAESVFEGAYIGLNQNGELVIEMAQHGCSCGDEGSECGCGDSSCGDDCGCH